MKKKIMIEGMSCGHCVGRVERTLKELEGVVDVQVDLQGKSAVVELKEAIDNEVIKEVIDDAGYDVLDIKNM